ncbi:RNA phosphodiesterase [Paraglaciecola Antarctic GD virus 1]|nr:RNA phosphodiesterase [Paraglaciecola Antarctic GD virus 1]
MKTYNQFILEKEDGTYVAVRFSDESNKKLKVYAKSLGLEPIKDFHATIVYSTATLDVSKGENPTTDTLTPKKLMYLGEVGNKYRAIALEVNSNNLQSIFDFYVKRGYKSKHPSFIQHISLAYAPDEGINIDDMELPDFDIEVTTIKAETLNGDI